MEEIKETSILCCKGCGIIKTRIMDGKHPNGKDIRWRDSEGGMFNGKLCPQCNRDRVALAKRNNTRSKKLFHV